jgi:hypothetical protein
MEAVRRERGRKIKRSPKLFVPYTVQSVADDDWVRQQDAASRIGTSVGWVRLLANCGRLVAVCNEAGEHGLRRNSVEREALRRNVPRWRKLSLMIGDLIRVHIGPQVRDDHDH